MKPWALLSSTLVVVLLVGGPAAAAPTCSFTSIVGVGFGAYDVFGTSPLDATGSIKVSCSGFGASDTIVLSLSRGVASSYAQRTMLSGGFSLAYNLYLDAGRTSIWGDGTSGTSQLGPVVPQNGDNLFAVYGRVPALQNVAAGTYSDTIVATILF